MQIDIDTNAGFCFGVTNAISKAEDEISNKGSLYCLGEMVHNQEETNRLTKMGMVTISYDDFERMHNSTVLLRAHGEPPSTYQTALRNNISIIDATCPIVLRLHKLIRENAMLYPEAQTVIYGKKAHAEVIGLNGQVDGKAVIISSPDDIKNIDFDRGILLYSQTTMNRADYNSIANTIQRSVDNHRKNKDILFLKFNTGCRSVANREKNIEQFATSHDTILFVAGANSSNGKYLYTTCKKANPSTYYISSICDLKQQMIQDVNKIGVTGATSTPKWLLHKIADMVSSYIKQN